MDKTELVVIGAGVVGLAVARALAQAGFETLIVEAAAGWGSGISSRNSEVVHAGLYYPPGSLKALLCVRGRALLYEYCAARGVPHRRCGKLVVAAQPADLPALTRIADTAAANGVDDLQWLDGAQARALEPALHCHAALLSPSTGIVDSHGLMTALLGDAEQAGALLALGSPLVGARPAPDGGWVLHTGGAEAFDIGARWVVNCAGLYAQAVARAMLGFPAGAVPALHLAKGHYLAVSGRAPFGRLVYPTPMDGGLGIHLTLDLGGQARLGPDVEWLPPGLSPDTIDYAADGARAAAFCADVRRWWPALDAGRLGPAYTGVRPKLAGPGQGAADFRIDGPAEHGVAGVVHLFGIESPGLTSALAIAEHVARMVQLHR